MTQSRRPKWNRKTDQRPDWRAGLYPQNLPDEDPLPEPPLLDGPVTGTLHVCHYCGYSPAAVPADETCPKCGMHSWETHTVPRRLIPQKF